MKMKNTTIESGIKLWTKKQIDLNENNSPTYSQINSEQFYDFITKDEEVVILENRDYISSQRLWNFEKREYYYVYRYGVNSSVWFTKSGSQAKANRKDFLSKNYTNEYFDKLQNNVPNIVKDGELSKEIIVIEKGEFKNINFNFMRFTTTSKDVLLKKFWVLT